MLKKFTQNNAQENILYNNILLLSRNKLFYTKFDFEDTFQNRINLIFLHISFLFIKIKQNNGGKKYNHFYQKMFDLIFKKIELNMREIGHGDTTINKNMKFLVKIFYNILLNCEKYAEKSLSDKKFFFSRYLKYKHIGIAPNNSAIIKYFDKYHSFCLDLCSDSVLKGELIFNYK